MVDISEVQKVFRPYENDLVQVIHEAWRRWSTLAPQFAKPTPRMRANVVHDLMVEEARKRFRNLPDVDVVDPPPRFLLRFEGRILVHFKKLDRRLRSHNYPTQLALAFGQQYQLPGIPDGTRITVGYLLDELCTEVNSVHAVLRKGNEIAWSYQLSTDALADRTDVLLLDHPAVPGARRIRAKRVEERREDES